MTKSDDFSKQMASHMDSNPGIYWQVEIVKNGKPSQVAGKVLNLSCIMFSVKEKTADLKRQELKSNEINQDSFDARVQREEDKRAQWEKSLQEIKPKIDAILGEKSVLDEPSKLKRQNRANLVILTRKTGDSIYRTKINPQTIPMPGDSK